MVTRQSGGVVVAGSGPALHASRFGWATGEAVVRRYSPD